MGKNSVRMMATYKDLNYLSYVYRHLLPAFIFLFVFTLISPLSCFSQSNIKIGFLIRDKGDTVLLHAAERAVFEANTKGGFEGKKFELVTRSCEGPWGVTSKLAVNLIYEEEVPIVVTALDGRNAHLVEQVAAKSHIVMLSTVSSDPTLSRAYVPWYFRIIPDDKQQSESLVEQIYIEQKARSVAVFSWDSYDGRKSAEAFESTAVAEGYPQPQILYEPTIDEASNCLKMSWDAIVFTGTSSEDIEISVDVNAVPIFAFVNFFSFSKQPSQFGHVRSAFHSPADYVFDGVSLAIESIKTLGPDSESIRKGFSALEYSGKTGKIVFDRLGNRIFD